MEPFALVILAVALVAVVAWGVADNIGHDREGARAAREAELSRIAQEVRDAKELRSRYAREVGSLLGVIGTSRTNDPDQGL